MNRREFVTLAAALPLLRAKEEGCEIAVMVLDKTHEDIFIHQQHLKRGDVIEALAPGLHWGMATMTNPHWMILRVPDLPLREAEALKTADPGDRRVNPMLHARAFGLDIAQFNTDVQQMIGDGSKRTREFITVSAADIRRAKFRKRPVPNPFVIGA